MPSRNVVKQYDINSFYHVYSRGVNKQAVFNSAEDYTVMIGLFKRYLSPQSTKTPNRTYYKNYSKDVNLVAYALMPNHIHLLLHQRDSLTAVSEFMRSLLTSYSMYFNRTYNRVGPLFQSRYLASRIDNDAYYQHISRYIHRNPKNWRDYEYTSLRYFTGEASADWLHPDDVLDMSAERYIGFLADYDPSGIDELSPWLANADEQ